MKKFALLSCLICVICACSKDDGGSNNPDNIEVVNSIKALDVGNTETSQDIYLEIVLGSTNADELRLIIVPSSVNTITVNQAVMLASDSYFSISNVNQSAYKMAMGINVKDVNGNNLSNDSNYIIRILQINGDDAQLSSKSAAVQLTTQNPFLGDYRGIWNDNIYTDFPVTARIKSFNNGTLSGEFFYTENFTPCCQAAQQGAVNDGTISMELNEDEMTITSYTYTQVLLTFMGGCNGTYNGSGSYSALKFNIDFIGNDCEGPHTNGNLVLDRIF